MSSVRRIGPQVKLRIERARSRHGAFDVAVQTFKRYSEDDGGFYAASLTYFAFFSIFPLLLFAVAALGYATFLSEEFQDRILNAGVESIPLIRQVVDPETLDLIQERRGTIALTGVALALYSGTGGIVSLQHALNRINRIREEGSFVAKRATALRLLAAIGALVVTTVSLGTVGSFLGGIVTATLAVVAGIATSVGLFAIAFKFLPSRRPAWSEVLPGAAVAGVLFEILKRLGAIYLKSGAEGRSDTFGAFATAATLLVSAYLLCQITLLAAELNAVLAERRVSREFSLADKSKGASVS